MRKMILVIGAILFLSVGAFAQDNTLAFAPPSPAASPAPTGFGTTLETRWQLAVGYQFTRLYLTGHPINTQGFDTSIVRYMNNWIGLEGAVGIGFGNSGSSTTPKNLVAKPIFAGGGIHLAHRSGYHLEPWVHGLVGLEHVRFTQSAVAFGSNSALGWTAGGGLDVHMNPRFGVRFEGDYVGTRLFGGLQRNYQGLAGVVFSF